MRDSAPEDRVRGRRRGRTGPRPARGLRTTDGGVTWTTVQRPPDRTGTWLLIGFTTPMVGYAFWQRQGPSYPANTAHLWRTTDGGATWSPVRI
jgi:photosystem II stability/assembly factor-like uncharacterized protein